MYSMVLMAALTTGGATPDCHFRCGGCCGCYGGCYGCYGGCWGCYGGCYGGFGGCYGGCWGGCYGCWGGYSSWGCCGCMGTYYGAPTYPGSIVPSGVAPGGAMPGAPQGEQLGKPSTDKKGTMAPSKAKLIVELPADAKLYIDDLPMRTASGTRAFSTPTLEPGQAYYYIVRAEVLRDGKPVSETRRVIVRAGQTIRADFKDLDSEAVRTAQAK